MLILYIDFQKKEKIKTKWTFQARALKPNKKKTHHIIPSIHTKFHRDWLKSKEMRDKQSAPFGCPPSWGVILFLNIPIRGPEALNFWPILNNLT